MNRIAWKNFVTTSSFTHDAVSEAKKSGMELLDKNSLIKYLIEEHKAN